jgi:hypothetical protein
MEKDGEQ